MNYKDIIMGYDASDKPEYEMVRNFIISEGYSVSLFDKNLNKLVLDAQMNKHTNSDYFNYDPVLNKINGNPHGERFIHELLHMASNNRKKDCLGVRDNFGTGVSLNEGITDYLTRCIVPTYNVNYIFETLFFESLCYMYPDIVEKLIACYFEGKPNSFYDLFGKDADAIINAVMELDKYTWYKAYRYQTNGGIAFERAINSLTDAFGLLINHCKENDKDMALEILNDFEDTVQRRINPKYTDGIINKIENELGVGMSL